MAACLRGRICWARLGFARPSIHDEKSEPVHDSRLMEDTVQGFACTQARRTCTIKVIAETRVWTSECEAIAKAKCDPYELIAS